MKIRAFRISLLISIMAFISLNTICQIIDSSSFKILTRQSFYSFEKDGEILLHVPPVFSGSRMSIVLNTGHISIATWNGIPGRNILRVPFPFNLKPSVYNIEARITIAGNPGKLYLSKCDLIILQYKSNEVKTDRLTGGLIVNKLPFFPFGFYCYSPVYPSLPEEEVVKGFNLISPYQKINTGDFC